MGRSLHRLSDVAVKARKRPGYAADGGNLYLRVAEGGSKGWIFRFTIGGRTRDAGLGAYPTVSLVKAREEAEKWRRLLAAGVDPIQARNEERQARRSNAANTKTFEECAKAYITSHQAGWRRAKTAQRWRSAMAIHVYPVLGAQPVGAVDTALVLPVLQPMWVDKPAMASRLRAMLESVLAWAKVQGYRTGENAAQWRGHLDQLLPSSTKVRPVRHHSALPFAEIPVFMVKLRVRSHLAARALEFLILTASRSSEARGARWDEINLEQRTWIIPVERMKGGREHRVPLEPRVVAILEEMAGVRLSEFVFPGRSKNRPISDLGLRMLVRELRPGVTIHGFRSSFRDWAAETTNFPNHVVEMALAHAIADGTEAAYRRGDLFEKRRKLMETWASYCERMPVSGKLVRLAQKRA